MSIFPFQKCIELIGKTPTNLLHIGAHLGEEAPIYIECGIQEIFFVEPNPELYQELINNVGFLNCCDLAVSDKYGEIVNFHKVYSHDRSNRGCSSLLKPTKILENPYLEQLETIQVSTTTIDHLDKDFGPFDCLVCDAQGFELNILKGAHNALTNNITSILTEFTFVSMYENDCLLQDLIDFLKPYGFELVHKEFATEKNDWGDCLFTKKEKK